MYPSIGAFVSDLDAVDMPVDIAFFLIFCFDGNDGRIEAAVVIAVRTSVTDVIGVDDRRANCF